MRAAVSPTQPHQPIEQPSRLLRLLRKLVAVATVVLVVVAIVVLLKLDTWLATHVFNQPSYESIISSNKGGSRSVWWWVAIPVSALFVFVVVNLVRNGRGKIVSPREPVDMFDAAEGAATESADAFEKVFKMVKGIPDDVRTKGEFVRYYFGHNADPPFTKEQQLGTLDAFVKAFKGIEIEEDALLAATLDYAADVAEGLADRTKRNAIEPKDDEEWTELNNKIREVVERVGNMQREPKV